MIGLCDCNSFYASCEALFRPDIRDKAILVLSNNDGIVIALNQKAKDIGFHRGDVYFKIKEEAKHNGAVCFSSNYELYADLSQRVINCLASHTVEVFPYSIDEAFFIPPKGIDAEKLRDTVINETGLPVSVGIARTKTLAKIANHLGKKTPSGACTLLESDEEEVLQKTPVEDIWGVGRRISDKLRKRGIMTAKALSLQDDGWIRNNFSITLLRTVKELRGEEATEEGENGKSFCSGISFKEPIKDYERLYKALAAQAQVLSLKLEDHDSVARVFVVSIFNSPFFGEFYSPHATVQMENGTNYLPEILKAVEIGLKKIYKPASYKGCRIFALDLAQKGARQYSLFDSDEEIAIYEKKERLNTVVSELSLKYGRNSVVPLSMLGADKKTLMKREMKSPSYTTRFDSLPLID
jgi:Nucleotidyltransferase/DNA polymerase involved in DNA repair